MAFTFYSTQHRVSSLVITCVSKPQTQAKGFPRNALDLQDSLMYFHEASFHSTNIFWNTFCMLDISPRDKKEIIYSCPAWRKQPEKHKQKEIMKNGLISPKKKSQQGH